MKTAMRLFGSAMKAWWTASHRYRHTHSEDIGAQWAEDADALLDPTYPGVYWTHERLDRLAALSLLMASRRRKRVVAQ